jgi:hypothetical protein
MPSFIICPLAAVTCLACMAQSFLASEIMVSEKKRENEKWETDNLIDKVWKT